MKRSPGTSKNLKKQAIRDEMKTYWGRAECSCRWDTMFFARQQIAAAGLEPATPGLWSLCSNQLSYAALWELLVADRNSSMRTPLYPIFSLVHPWMHKDFSRKAISLKKNRLGLFFVSSSRLSLWLLWVSVGSFGTTYFTRLQADSTMALIFPSSSSPFFNAWLVTTFPLL